MLLLIIESKEGIQSYFFPSIQHPSNQYTRTHSSI